MDWEREREGEREERKEREKRKAEEMFCRRGDAPARLCDVLNEKLRSKRWTELTTKGDRRVRERLSGRARRL
jgi:hypothetical protein